ncbi:MAG: transglycosylase SLT domain-containing protein [Betaproteobacteria bacterium]|nr:transglycosylase SLT domain-containing protein [Betaproteobacteria bacterium]
MADLRHALFTIVAGAALAATVPAHTQEHAHNRANVSEAAAPQEDFYDIRPATVDCVIKAAQRQGVPANVLLAIASVEGGKNGQVVENKNGTYDLGHLQINSIHFTPNGRFGKLPITKEDVTWRGCYNAELAAWMLRQHLEEPDSRQDFWTRAANYHSHTPELNARYRQKLIPLSVAWGDWLQQRYAKQDAPIANK